MNLGETGVLLGPEDGAAAAVEGVDITVFSLQPCLEFLLACGAGAAAGSFLGQLVVYLEACYVRVGAVVAADGRGDGGAVFPEFLVVVTAVAAAAKGAADTTVILIEHIRPLFHHPGRRARRGRSHDGADAGISKLLYDRIEPGEIISSRLRLHAAPGEFPHAHGVDAGFLQQLNIPGKVLFRLVLRVIRYSI